MPFVFYCVISLCSLSSVGEGGPIALLPARDHQWRAEKVGE